MAPSQKPETPLSPEGAVAYGILTAALQSPPSKQEYVDKANELSTTTYGTAFKNLASEKNEHLIRELTIAYFLSSDDEREQILGVFSKNKDLYWYGTLTNNLIKDAIEQYAKELNIATLSNYREETLIKHLKEKNPDDAATVFEEAIHLDRYVFFKGEKKKWEGFITELFTESHAVLPYKLMADDPLLVRIKRELGSLFKNYDEKTNSITLKTAEELEKPLLLPLKKKPAVRVAPAPKTEGLPVQVPFAPKAEGRVLQKLPDTTTFLVIGKDIGGRSDSITLLTYNEKTNTLDMIAVYRGLEIVPGEGLVNWILPKEGREQMKEKLEGFFGVKIDGWVLTDLDKFKKIVENIKKFEKIKSIKLLNWFYKTTKEPTDAPLPDSVAAGLQDRAMPGGGFERARNSARFIAHIAENLSQYNQQNPGRASNMLEILKLAENQILPNIDSNVPPDTLLGFVKAVVENQKELAINLYEVPHVEQRQFTAGGAEYYLPTEVGGETYFDGIIKKGPFETYPQQIQPIAKKQPVL